MVVIFLPCGAGFIHKDLAAALTTYKEITQVHITGTDSLLEKLSLAVNEQIQKEPTIRIILHGWSLGGAVILAQRDRPKVLSVFLYAAADRCTGCTFQEDVFLYHNVYDTVINVTVSETNAKILNGTLALSHIKETNSCHRQWNP